MKKLLYFLIGFAVVVFPVRYMAYAGTDYMACLDINFNPSGYTWVIQGIYDNYDDALQASIDYNNASTTVYSNLSRVPSVDTSCMQRSRSLHRSGDYSVDMLWFIVDANYVEFADEDGDGLDSDCDLYDDDPNPHQYAVISEVTDSSGTPVNQVLLTDEGDLRTIGERPEDMTGYTDQIIISPQMKDNQELCDNPLVSGIGSGTSASSDYYTNVENYITAGTDPGVASETDDNPSTSSDGTETDNQALQKIITNTDSTNKNIGVLANYLKSINDNIGQINKKSNIESVVPGSTVFSDSSGGSGDISGDIQDGLSTTQSDTDDSIASMGNTDTEFSEIQSTITGDADLENDAPSEFSEKLDISARLTSYISNNPISDIINGTTITISGSEDELSWDYNGTAIKMSVGKYDSALQAFGAILLAMTTLSGMLLVFRGF